MLYLCCTQIKYMASTKLLLRTTKVLKNGEHPIVLRVIKDRKTKMIFTGFSCSAAKWDFKENKPKKSHPNSIKLELFLNKKKAEAQGIILNLENENKEYSTESFKQLYKVSSKKITVFKYYDQIIANLIKTNKIGNSNAYKQSKAALFKFRNGKDIFFSDIDYSFLNKFESFLAEKNCAINTIGVYMRNLRAVFKKAIAEKYCKQDIYPFTDYKVSKLVATTKKRALRKDQVKKIIELELKPHSKILDSKHYFLFSYYNRGMNFKDIANLTWANIANDRLFYIRAKTKENFDMAITEPVKQILDYYKPYTGKKKENYIFPILDKEVHVSAMQKANREKKVLKLTNKKLKEIATLTDIDFNLTTYVARHSYATVLKRSGATTSAISESMGHDSEKTTQIYLDSFENIYLDEINKAILQ